MALTSEQVSTLKRYLEQSETMHHRIMAKMTDPRFDLLDAWEQKERLDQGDRPLRSRGDHRISGPQRDTASAAMMITFPWSSSSIM